jgi:hypothetical protein
MSLYFFATTDFDRDIQQAFLKFPAAVQTRMFFNDYAWHHNRPSPKEWVTIIETAPIDWETDEAKAVKVRAVMQREPDLSSRPWPGPEK